MKKRLFVVLAAMIVLAGMSANAQVKNDNPQRVDGETSIRGDVNEDGIVDVADINAIIEIMKNNGTTTYYWYVGTTKPTSLSQASTVTSYPAEQTYTNNSGAKSKVYVLTNSNKTVTFINPTLNMEVDKVVDTTTISGYSIWETAVGVANSGSVKIQIS